MSIREKGFWGQLLAALAKDTPAYGGYRGSERVSGARKISPATVTPPPVPTSKSDKLTLMKSELEKLKIKHRENKIMSDFNPTHEFRGLELEHHPEDGFVYGLGPFYDESGKQYFLDMDVVTKLTERPQPGEVWKCVGRSNGDPNILRGVDTLGCLFDLVHKIVVWDPDEDESESLLEEHYVKILNADGTPYKEDS